MLPPSLKVAWTRCSGECGTLAGNSEHITGMLSTLGSLLLYLELWYHFTTEIKVEEQTGTSH